MSRIFISYRREDSSGYAGRIYDRLSQHFGPDQIFMDIDNIRPGMDFVDAIEKAVGSCDVLIALIGKQWVRIKDANGNQRLSNPYDFVRLEIKTALDRSILVVPALVQGAGMPQLQDLPEDLKKITRRNAIEISDSRFHEDVNRLITELNAVLGIPREVSFRQPRGKHATSASDDASRWWRVWITLIGFLLMSWVLMEAWFTGFIQTDLLLFLSPLPYVILGFDHFRKGRLIHGIIFLASLGLLFSEISPYQPRDFFPSSVLVTINILTSIAISLATLGSIIDVVGNRTDNKG